MRRLVILLFLLPIAVHAQLAEHLFFDAVAFASPSLDSTDLDLYAAVPRAMLEFTRDGNAFVGHYTVRLKVEGNGRMWLDTSIRRDVASPVEVGGNVGGAEFLQQRVRVPAGNYTASIDLLDHNSNLSETARRVATTISYRSYPFALSGLLLVGRIREDTGGFVIAPLLTENVNRVDGGYFLFFETYNDAAHDSVRFTTTYRSASGDIVPGPSFIRATPRGRGQQWVRLPNEGMSRGVYSIEVKATSVNDTTRVLASAQRSVRFEAGSENLPISEDELDERIAQLRYVAPQSEVDLIRHEESYESRKHAYAAFWSNLDPTPGTAVNEAMDDYFERIEYANAHFRSYASGWQTDKGRVYVIYGAPDNVTGDTHRSDGKNVEVWHYYSQSRTIVFSDDSGFGDFRLVTPLPPGEKYHYGR
jgi:GWxTD domain-containing protein